MTESGRSDIDGPLEIEQDTGHFTFARVGSAFRLSEAQGSYVYFDQDAAEVMIQWLTTVATSRISG